MSYYNNNNRQNNGNRSYGGYRPRYQNQQSMSNLIPLMMLSNQSTNNNLLPLLMAGGNSNDLFQQMMLMRLFQNEKSEEPAAATAANQQKAQSTTELLMISILRDIQQKLSTPPAQPVQYTPVPAAPMVSPAPRVSAAPSPIQQVQNPNVQNPFQNPQNPFVLPTTPIFGYQRKRARIDDDSAPDAEWFEPQIQPPVHTVSSASNNSSVNTSDSSGTMTTITTNGSVTLNSTSHEEDPNLGNQITPDKVRKYFGNCSAPSRVKNVTTFFADMGLEAPQTEVMTSNVRLAQHLRTNGIHLDA